MFTHPVDAEVSLVLLQPHHAQALLALMNRNAAYSSRWLPLTRLETVQQAQELIGGALHRLASDGELRCGVLYQGELVGRASLHSVSHAMAVAELGYLLAEEYTGRGIMTRALRALVHFAFTALEIARLEIYTAAENASSRTLAERLGFTYELTHRQKTWLRDQPADFAVYGLLREEWQSAAAPPAAPPPAPPRFAYRIDDTLVFGPLLRHDAAALRTAISANRARLEAWLNWPHHIHTLHDAQEHIAGSLRNFAADGRLRCGIWRAGLLVGGISIVDFDTYTNALEIGYWVDARHSGGGVITRATRALTDAAFGELGMNRVVIRCAVDNARSRAVAERLGFVLEGVLRANNRPGGVYQDIAHYSMLREDWQ